MIKIAFSIIAVLWAAQAHAENYLRPGDGKPQPWNVAIQTPITNTTPIPVRTATTGNRQFVTSWTASNSHASVGTDVELLDGSEVLDFCPAATNYGGCAKQFEYPLMAGGGTISCRSRTTGASVRCQVQGYDSKHPPTPTPTPTSTSTPTATPTP